MNNHDLNITVCVFKIEAEVFHFITDHQKQRTLLPVISQHPKHFPTSKDQISQLLLTSVSMTSAEKIAGNENLLSEILLRLPVRCLLRFKCVSKLWLTIISSSHFSCTHSKRNFHSLSLSGFLFRDSNGYGYIGFNGARFPIARSLAFMKKPGITIVQSCNGLVLCSCKTFDGFHFYKECFIFNPTTLMFSSIPPLPVEGHHRNLVSFLNLAFDPSRSPHFTIVCACAVFEGNGSYEIFHTGVLLYSSSSRSWLSIESPDVDSKFCYHKVVFFNGSLYWLLNGYQRLLRFDVDTQRFNTITMITDSDLRARFATKPYPYLGQCNGKLYLLAEASFSSTGLVVFELVEDCSSLLFKYNVELFHVVSNIDEFYLDDDCCPLVLSVVGGEADDDLRLLLSLPNSELISYSIKEKTTTIMPDLNCPVDPHLYMENLSPVI